MKTLLWIAWAVLSAGETERPVDVIELVNGKQVKGIVLFEDSERVILKTRSRSKEYRAEDVASIDSLRRNLADVLDQQKHTDWNATDQVMALARYCESKGMQGLARVFALRALENDPALVEAHEFLGHSRRGDTWRVRERGRSTAFDKLADKRSDWGEEWVLETPHYTLHTNLELGQAVDLACDLEHFYRAFYSLLGGHMELLEVTQRMPANVHADSVSFPEFIGGQDAYFRPSDFTLIVNAESGLNMQLLFHEAAHQLLHMTSDRERNGRGSIPGWLNEGLADVLGAGASGDPGRMGIDGSARNDGYFNVQRSSGDPYSLSRILTMDSTDFHGSSNRQLKYAQCYTLVHFLLHAKKERFRPGFFRFLESAFDGRSSSGHFEKSMGISREDLEEEWLEYVRRAGR